MHLSSFLSSALLIVVLLLVFLATSCSHYPRGKTFAQAPPSLARDLKADVEFLAGEIGERNLYHPAKLAKAADWLEQQFKSMGYETVRRFAIPVNAGSYRLPADGLAYNIEAVLPGTTMADEHIVIGAHYDSKVAMPDWHGHWPPTPEVSGTPGANDNASGIATVLALARRFAGQPRARTLRFVAFANEEPPFYQTDVMGSLVYARMLKAQGLQKVRMLTPETLGCYSSKQHRKRIRLATWLGLPERANYIAFVSNRGSLPWVRACAERFAEHSTLDLRTLSLPAVAKKVAWSDDWAFWQCGYPAFAVTDTAYFRSDQYHELNDTPETLDYQPMAEVVWALGQMVSTLADNG